MLNLPKGDQVCPIPSLLSIKSGLEAKMYTYVYYQENNQSFTYDYAINL